MVRVVIWVDMEGIAGIETWDQVSLNTRRAVGC